MFRVLSVTTSMRSLILAACFALAGASALSAEGVDVGSIADLDLEAVRRIIDASDDSGLPRVTERRALSLEESVKTALENNLRLQISELGVEAGAEEIDAARARFHPTAGVQAEADGTKRARDATPDEKTDSQEVIVFLEQEVPTGGTVKIGSGYGRDFTDENAEAGGGNF